MKLRALQVGLLGLLLATAACVAADEEGAEAVEQSVVTNRSDRDVAVLQAWIGETVGRRFNGGYQLGDRVLDYSRCGSDHECTSAAQDLFESVLVGGFRYDAEHSGQCETIEIRTVVREASFRAPTFRGIGLYLSSVGGEVFVSKDVLATRGDSGQVTLKDGTRGIVHRFVAQGMCFGLGGNGGSLLNRTYDIKPYVRFDAGDDSYKIWDVIQDEYRLGKPRDGRGFVRTFDRQDELLAR